MRRELLAPRLHPGVPVLALDDLVGDELLVLFHHRVGIAAANQALDSEKRVGRIGHALALGRQTDQAFAIFGEGDDRGGRIHTLGVGDHLGLTALHDGDTGIGSAKIDTDDFGHGERVLCLWQTARTLRGRNTLGVRRPLQAGAVPSLFGVRCFNRPTRVA